MASASFFPNMGGAEVTLHNLARRLRRRGHRVVVIVGFSHWRRMVGRRKDLGYPLYPIPPWLEAAALGDHALLRRLPQLYLAALQRRFRFDVWQSFGLFPAGIVVARFASSRRIPHVVRTIGYDVQRSPDLGYGVRLDPAVDNVSRAWARHVDRLVILTESVRPDCLELGADPAKVEVLPCGVDIARFQETPVDRVAVRDRYGIPVRAFVFLAVGRNHPKKGFDLLVRALPHLRREASRGFHLVFVGKGMESLRTLANELGVASLVTWVDSIPVAAEHGEIEAPPSEVVRLYRAADACVFPSLLETFGNVNIEAMAAGLPLISTDAPGCRDIVEDGVNGLVARAGDADDLARQMLRLLEAPGLAGKLAEAGLETVRSKYDWEIVVQQYERLYASLLEGR